MGTEMVEHHVDDGIGWISLNQPRRKNALQDDMFLGVGVALDEFERDERVRTIVIKGNGGNFSAGFDLTQGLPDPYRDYVKNISSKTCRRLWYHPKPTISMVLGYCVGGGFELAMGSDLVYAADDARLGEPEIDFFFTPDYNCIPCLSMPRKAKEIILLGQVVSGTEAAEIGLINAAFPGDRLEDEVRRVCRRIAALSADTVAVAKTGLNGAIDAQGFADAIRYGEEIAIYNGLLSKTNPATQAFYKTAEEQGLKAAIAAVRDYDQGGEGQGWKR